MTLRDPLAATAGAVSPRDVRRPASSMRARAGSSAGDGHEIAEGVGEPHPHIDRRVRPPDTDQSIGGDTHQRLFQRSMAQFGELRLLSCRVPPPVATLL